MRRKQPVKNPRLNPIEIMAGLEPLNPYQIARAHSLNPFEIRAGLEPAIAVQEHALECT